MAGNGEMASSSSWMVVTDVLLANAQLSNYPLSTPKSLQPTILSESKANYQLDGFHPIHRENKHFVCFNRAVFSDRFLDVGTMSLWLLPCFPLSLWKKFDNTACLSRHLLCFCLQSMTNASAASTTVTRTPCASTWSEATVAPVSRVTLATGLCAKVSAENKTPDILTWWWDLHWLRFNSSSSSAAHLQFHKY